MNIHTCIPKNIYVKSALTISAVTVIPIALTVIFAVMGAHGVLGSSVHSFITRQALPFLISKTGPMPNWSLLLAGTLGAAGLTYGIFCVVKKSSLNKSSSNDLASPETKRDTTNHFELPDYVFTDPEGSTQRAIGDMQLLQYIFQDEITTEKRKDILKWSFSQRKVPTGSFQTNYHNTNVKHLPNGVCVDNRGFAATTNEHGMGIFIPDDEILRVYSCEEALLCNAQKRKGAIAYQPEETSSSIYMGLSVLEDKEIHVLQQRGQRACVPTAIAMLLLDRREKFEMGPLISTSLGNPEPALVDLGVSEKYIYEEIDQHSLDKKSLQQALEMHGSLLVSTASGGIDSHTFILDAVDLKQNTAAIRDPYHGWCISIGLDYFLSLRPELGYLKKKDDS